MEKTTTITPHPKPGKRKKVRVDWSGFTVPKYGLKLGDYEYSKLKKKIIEKRGARCCVCGEKFPANCLTLHHKTKRSILRLDTEENCDLVCINCHIEER